MCDHCNASGASRKRSRQDFEQQSPEVPEASIDDADKLDEPTSASNRPGEPSEEEIAAMLAAAEASASEAPSLDILGVKKLLLQLEKKVTKNQLARAKFSDQPSRFLESELELDEDLKKMRVLAAAPELYPVLVSSEALGTLLSLLSHDNIDIACEVVSLLSELTDEDAIGVRSEAMAPLPELDDEEDDDDEIAALAAAQRAREVFLCGLALVEGIASTGGLGLLVQHLGRLDEGRSEEDSQGVYATLGLLQNLAEAQP